MMKNFHVSFTEAADALEIPEADRPKFKKLVEDQTVTDTSHGQQVP